MKEFAKTAMAVDPKIRRYIATQFVKDAATRHSIAFFQWRLAFGGGPSTEEVQEVIDNRLGGLGLRAFTSGQKLHDYQLEQPELYKRQSQFVLDFKTIQKYGGL
jgi:hypothetical protein